MARNGSLARHGIGPGHIPGGEIAGFVDAVGDGVDAAWLGQPVWAFIGLGGGYASQALVPVAEVVPVPDGLSLTDTLALGTAGVVAHYALDHANFRVGDAVLVRGAGGPLGIMAVQLAALRAAGVIAVTASSLARGEQLRNLGATRILDRMGEASDEAAQDFDIVIVIDVAGGADTPSFVRKLKPGGRIVLVGAVAGPPADMTATMFELFQRSLSFSTFSANIVPANDRRAMTANLFDLASRREVRTIIAGIIPLAQAAEAHRRLEAGGVFGRLVLAPYER